MDLTASIAPRSDQLNADDLISGPVTVTVQEVVEGSAEQPVDVRLVEFPGRAYRPSKSMRRVMVLAWGSKSPAYTGRRLTLYRNPEITFGKDKVGGIEISHLSDIPKPLTVALTATRGRRKAFTVQPLPDAPAPQQDEPWRAQWQAIKSALTAAGYDGDSKQLLATAGQVIGAAWDHPNKISPEDAQKILAAVREDDHQEAAAS